jgi:hypothetical protein
MAESSYQPVKSAAGFSEGDIASWKDGKGKIEHIMINGSLGTGKFRIKATKSNPAFLLRIYKGNTPTEMLTGKSASELTRGNAYDQAKSKS